MLVEVKNKPTYKEIVMTLLRESKGPRDHELMQQIMADAPALECNLVPSEWAQAFKRFMYDQEWTLGAILSYLSWHGLYLNGEICLEGFEGVWPEAFQIIKNQSLLERRTISVERRTSKEAPVTVGSFIE